MEFSCVSLFELGTARVQKARQTSDRGTGAHCDNDKRTRQESDKLLRRDNLHAPRHEKPDDDRNENVLADGSAPFTQADVDVGIVSALMQRPPAERRQRCDDEGEIAEIQSDDIGGVGEAQKGLDRIGQHGDAEEKDKINNHIRRARDKVVAENPIVRQPDGADHSEGNDESRPACR